MHIKGNTFRSAAISLLFLIVFGVVAAADQDTRAKLNMDSSEAEAVVAILNERASGQDVAERDWQKLLSSKPYQVLKLREESFHNAFTDADFKKFVLSPDLAAQREALRKILQEWSRTDLQGAAERLLAYLPASSVIQSNVFPIIKPQKNSFVFHSDSGPAIFLSLDPTESVAHFQNKVVHELHHIGLDSFMNQYEQRIANLPERPQKASRWIGSFGEGLAMLAAAGGPGVHPHATSKLADRERWDRDIANFNSDLRAVDQFLRDVADGKLQGDSIIKRGESFYGIQGPWYT